MVDSTICPRCSSPIRPGETSCAYCGEPLAAGTQDEAHDGDPGVSGGTIRMSDPRDATGDEGGAGEGPSPRTSAASGEPEPSAPAAPPVHVPAGWPIDLRSMAEPPASPRPRESEPEPEPEPEPADDVEDHVPGGYFAPSAIHRGSGLSAPERGQASPHERSAAPSMSLSVGAVPVTLARPGTPLRPGAEAPEPAPATVAPPTPAFVAAPAPLAEPSADRSAAKPTATPAATPAAAPARKEPVQQLVAFGLVASGGVLGIASFFLPWAGSTGIGIGTVAMAGSPPQPNQWAWGMPAAIPLFLLTGIVLAASAGSDRAQHRLPDLASVIGRVTDLILPMLLGGLYFGASLLYVTLPYGFGTGIFVLSVAACLLVAGSIVALFFPPGDGSAAG